jgi:hypothetical protein
MIMMLEMHLISHAKPTLCDWRDAAQSLRLTYKMSQFPDQIS